MFRSSLFRSSLGLAALVCLVSIVLSAPVGAQARATKLRVLLITGNKSYEREPFLDIFHSDPAIELTHLEHTAKEADAWERADTTSCDAVVLYDMPRDISDAQKTRFLALFERGIGLVALHHALVSFQRWPEYERIIGGRWFDLPEKGGDPRETPSGYEHDVDQQVRVVPGHAVTNGVTDFAIHDEIYWGYRVGKDVSPLLTTSHPKSGNPIAWTRVEQKSRVVYLQLGHGPSAYSSPSYRRLIHNSIRFAARR